MPAQLVSVINMKGGVGKSTTTVALAETLAVHQRLKTLVIDLDPQTNASIMIAGPQKWDALREAERTLDFYFEAYATGEGRPKPFKTLREDKISDLKGAPDVAVIAAAPEFRTLERDMIETFVKKGYHLEAIQRWIAERFINGLKSIVNDHDLILIDCPPGISLFAEAALIASDAILVPSIPDYMSRLGLISFRKRALRMLEDRRQGPAPLFVLATKYEQDMPLHRSEAALLKDNLGDAMFDVRIPQIMDVARAAEWSDTPRTFDQKYGAGADIIRALGDEFVAKIGPRAGQERGLAR